MPQISRPHVSRRQKIKVARKVAGAKSTRRLAKTAARHPRRTAKVARGGLTVMRHRSAVARGTVVAVGGTILAVLVRKRSKASSAPQSTWNDSYRTTPTPGSSQHSGPTAVPTPASATAANNAKAEADTTTPPHGDPLGPNEGAQAASPQVADAEDAARKN